MRHWRRPTQEFPREASRTAANARSKEARKIMTESSEGALKAWVLALTSVASLMVALDALVVTTALGTIRLDLDASIEALQWTMNAYNLTFAVLLFTAAPL